MSCLKGFYMQTFKSCIAVYISLSIMGTHCSVLFQMSLLGPGKVEDSLVKKEEIFFKKVCFPLLLTTSSFSSAEGGTSE